MQGILDDRAVEDDHKIEIRSLSPRVPLRAADLISAGVRVCEQSRLLSFGRCPLRLGVEHFQTLSDPITSIIRIDAVDDINQPYVDVSFHQGVTDVEGAMAALALEFMGVSGVSGRSGSRYRFAEPVAADIRPTVERILGNPLIHQFDWSDAWPAAGSSVDEASRPAHPVRTIGIRACRPDDLLRVSSEEGLALDAIEMAAVQRFFGGLGRDPTDVELQSVALAWSEHCGHKTFKAPIDFRHGDTFETINGLLDSCIAGPSRRLHRPWVRSSFVDNAGVIALDDEFDLAFKVETHNHPSALEPFGGAHTGVGGVIRDVLAVSATPIANTDVLCFGPISLDHAKVPEGTLHPRTVFREVVRGVADYGNNMGTPTVAGAVLFHDGYSANPLVYCGTLGIAPRGSHPTEPKAGDSIVLLGGRTGRDGLHGATMSSATLDRATVATSTVQIGAPITEKLVADALPQLRNERLYNAITDCGAGGLCSAIGEMGADLGVEVDLALVPLKYEGLAPWEIWLSEAQERMVLAVPDKSLGQLVSVCRSHGVEASVLGRFRTDGALLLSYDGDVVADMPIAFMQSGHPARTLLATWPCAAPADSRRYRERPASTGREPERLDSLVLALLAHPNISSKEEVVRRFDHEVQGNTVGKPIVGLNGHSDAAVLRPRAESWTGAVLAHGINPLYGHRDPYDMAMLAVDEALRNLVAVGGSIDRAALLDNFCWGAVDEPEELGGLVRAAQGCRDAVVMYDVPFICGKDSLRNTSRDGTETHSIPGTLLISAVGVVDDVRRCITSDLKRSGSTVYIVGLTSDELGGSHLNLLEGASGGVVPQVRSESPLILRRLAETIDRGLALSCHDLSEGGLAIAAAEMMLSGGFGLTIQLDALAAATVLSVDAALFSESPGRFLVEVPPSLADEFEGLLSGLPHACIGNVVDAGRLRITSAGSAVVDLELSELDRAWRTPLNPDSCESSPPPRRSAEATEVSTPTGITTAAYHRARGASHRPCGAGDKLRPGNRPRPRPCGSPPRIGASRSTRQRGREARRLRGAGPSGRVFIWRSPRSRGAAGDCAPTSMPRRAMALRSLWAAGYWNVQWVPGSGPARAPRSGCACAQRARPIRVPLAGAASRFVALSILRRS